MLPPVTIARAPLAAFAVMGIVWGTYAAVFPDLKAMLGVNEGEMGLLIFCTPLAAVTAMLLAPTFGARFGRVALPVATIAMALAVALPGQAASVWLFPPALMVCGAATGLTDVLLNARVVALESERGRPLMNLCHAAYSLGYGGAAILTGMMRGASHGPGTVTAVMALCALALALTTWERTGANLGFAARGSAGDRIRLGWVPYIGGAIVLIAFLTENAFENWSALHIEKTLGGSPQEGSMGPATIALTMAVARLFGQSIAQKVPGETLLGGGAMIAAAGAVIAAAAPTPLFAYAGFVVMGLGASVVAPTAFSLVGRHAGIATRARAVTRTTQLGYLGYFFGPPLLGMIAGQFGLRMAFVFTACILLSVLVLARLLTRAGQGAKVAP